MNLKRTHTMRPTHDGTKTPGKQVILGVVFAVLIVGTPFALHGINVGNTQPSPTKASVQSVANSPTTATAAQESNAAPPAHHDGP